MSCHMCPHQIYRFKPLYEFQTASSGFANTVARFPPRFINLYLKPLQNKSIHKAIQDQTAEVIFSATANWFSEPEKGVSALQSCVKGWSCGLARVVLSSEELIPHTVSFLLGCRQKDVESYDVYHYSVWWCHPYEMLCCSLPVAEYHVVMDKEVCLCGPTELAQ